MEWIEVKSSNLWRVKSYKGDLIVQFKNRRMYRYIGAKHELNQIINADSSGIYLNRIIKVKYDVEEINE